jgi:HD-like signal output (HDOD) protein/CheY-like chemotaxis protein
MPRILFVDDEPRVLDGLRRLLRVIRPEWEAAFASHGEKALEMLALAPYDVLVTDLRMPGIDGSELLEQVRRRFPDTARIALSGQADRTHMLKSLGCAHQCLAKPCEAEALKDAIHRALGLRGALVDPGLKRVISRVRCLPSIPAMYQDLIAALRAPETSGPMLARIIGQDMAMSAKVLQLANSAYFGARRQLSDLAEAVLYLGLDTIGSLAFSMGVFSVFEAPRFREFGVAAIWQHSLATAALARRIMKSEGASKKAADDALMAGLLHDAGKLLFASECTEAYRAVFETRRALRLTDGEAERRVFGAAHPELGAYLLRLWGLPDGVTEAVAFHEFPGACAGGGFSPVTAVHVADALEHELDETGDRKPDMDAAYLKRLGLLARVPEWRGLREQLTEA